MSLRGVRIVSRGPGGELRATAELRLQGGRAVAVSGGDRAGIADMLDFGIDFRRGDAAAASRLAKRHGVRLPDLKRGQRIRVTPDKGELFLLAVLSRYARPAGYSWAEAVGG